MTTDRVNALFPFEDRFTTAESPIWDEREGVVLWCDIPACEIFEWSPGTGARRRWRLPKRVCSLGLAGSGRLVVALDDEVGLFDRDTAGYRSLARFAFPRPDIRLNDGKVGPDGAFWVGSMDERPAKQPVGCLYRVTVEGRIETKLDGLLVSNGLAWSPDGGTLFHADTRGPWIDAWSFDPATGAIAARRRIATPDEATGRPDGGATDAQGCYWSAGVSAGCLNRFTADGRLLDTVVLPVPSPTMPCFFGPRLDRLFVTSLNRSASGDAPAPQAGMVVVLASEVAGAPVARFDDIG